MAAPRAGLGQPSPPIGCVKPSRRPPPVAACFLFIGSVPFLDATAQSIYSAPMCRAYVRATPALAGQEPGDALPPICPVDEERRFVAYQMIELERFTLGCSQAAPSRHAGRDPAFMLRLRSATLSTNGSPLVLSVRRSAPEVEGLHGIVICSIAPPKGQATPPSPDGRGVLTCVAV